MTDQRELHVEVLQPDSKWLSDNQYQLQIAKSVFTNGQLKFNMVWKSSIIGPQTYVRWKPVYALNWTSDVPAAGVSVTVGGSWKRCDVGKALDINSDGFLVESTAQNVDKDYINVGKNNYKSQSPDGIRMIVGLQVDSTPGQELYQPIFVDPVSISFNMSAKFQPQEKVQWWYDSGSMQGTVFTDHSTTPALGDFSAPDSATGTFKKYSRYNRTSGAWETKAV